RDAIAAYHDLIEHREAAHFSSVVAGIQGHLARHNLALVYEDAGDLDQAKEQWQLILADRPDYRPAWRAMGVLALRQGRPEEALALADRLLANPRLRANGSLLRGRVAIARGDREAAASDWNHVVQDYPSDRDALAEAAQLLFENVSPRAASAALE